jgi:hypothetical protein
MKRPDSVSRNGAPCETLGSMPQRVSLASMRRARAASGVTIAAVAARLFQASRTMSAIAVASSSSVAASSKRKAARAFANETFAAGGEALEPVGGLLGRRQALRASAHGARGHLHFELQHRNSSRSTPSAASVCFQRVLRMLIADQRQLSSSRSTSTPGKDHDAARQGATRPASARASSIASLWSRR